MNENAKTRLAILEVLYKARATQVGKLASDGWVSEAELKNAVGDVAFALSVLEELQFINRSGYKLRITGAGVLACEQGQSRRSLLWRCGYSSSQASF